MKLHVAPRSRSIRARWLLEELGVPYEVVHRENPEDVPVLVDEAVTMNVSSAICLYLADRYPGFAPPLDSPERGPYLQWLLFAEVSLEPAVLELMRNPAAPRARLEALLTQLEARLAGRECIATDSFSAADLATASILHLANTLGLLEGHPALFDYTLRHAKRPAVRRALS